MALSTLSRRATGNDYGVKNYGRRRLLHRQVSGRRRNCSGGYHAVIHGDEELACWGDSNTGKPVNGSAVSTRALDMDVEQVSALVADQSHAATF